MEEFIDLVDFGDLSVAYPGQSPAGTLRSWLSKGAYLKVRINDVPST